MNLTFFFSLLFVSHYSMGQMDDTVEISKATVKAFFADTRQIINGDKKYFYIIDKPSVAFPETEKDIQKHLKDFKLDSFFTPSDVNFLCTQIKHSKTIVWDSTYIEQSIIVKETFIDSVLHSPLEKDRIRIGLPAHYRMSFPLFNSDKTFCYISTYYWCGWLCGQQTSYLFKRINNQWKKYRVSYGPVS